MKLNEFLKQASKRERADVATVCHHSVGYLYQLAGGHRYASALMATQIELATARVAQHSQGVWIACHARQRMNRSMKLC